MNGPAEAARPVAAVGLVCLKGDAVLMIKRGKPPMMGQWSLPGGRIEWGERMRDAALRELKEETGCSADIVGLIDAVDALIPDSSGAITTHYVLVDFAARWTDGDPCGGDDATDARFFEPAELAELGLWEETMRVIDAARALISAA